MSPYAALTGGGSRLPTMPHMASFAATVFTLAALAAGVLAQAPTMHYVVVRATLS